MRALGLSPSKEETRRMGALYDQVTLPLSLPLALALALALTLTLTLTLPRCWAASQHARSESTIA